MIDVKSNWGSARAKWAAIKIQPELRKWAEEVSPEIEAALKAKAPVAKVNGGRFRQTIRSQVTFTATETKLEAFSRLSYAKYIIEGTSAHEIVPRHARALHFNDVFAKHVNHPGTKPNKFAEEVKILEGPRIVEKLNTRLKALCVK